MALESILGDQSKLNTLAALDLRRAPFHGRVY